MDSAHSSMDNQMSFVKWFTKVAVLMAVIIGFLAIVKACSVEKPGLASTEMATPAKGNDAGGTKVQEEKAAPVESATEDTTTSNTHGTTKE